MTAVNARPRPISGTASNSAFRSRVDVRAWINRGIETSWLIAAAVTPVIVLSETAFLSKTELPKVATVRVAAGVILLFMLADAMRAAWQGSLTLPSGQASYRRFLGDARGRVKAAAVALVIAALLSSVFALFPRLSTWGSDPGGESNSLYTTAAYAALFFAIATRLRSPVQVWRLLGAMVLAGTLAALVGVAQHLGYAPFGIRSTSGSARVSGTAGNPIFFATILAVTMILATGLSLMLRDTTRRSLALYGVLGLVVAVQLTALLVTLSRGPWLGASAGLLVMGVLALFAFDRARVVRTGLLLAIAFAAPLVFLGVVSAPTPPPVDGDPEKGFIGISRTSVDDVQGRATTLDGVFDAVSNPRLDHWSGAMELAANRPNPPSGSQPGYVVRSLFGYGPDSFPDVFTLVAPARLSGIRGTAAHNIPLNRLVETGLLGLLAWAAFWVSLSYLLLRQFWTQRRIGGPAQVVTLATGAALAAWLLAGMTGIPQTGDSVLVWLLAGLAVAVPQVFSKGVRTVAKEEETTAFSRPSAAIQTFTLVFLGAAALATIWVTWSQNLQRVSADSTAASAVAFEPKSSGVTGRLELIDRAIDTSSDQPRYHTIRSEIHERIAMEGLSSDPYAAMRESRDSAERALSLNPLDRDLNFRAAYVNWELAKLGDTEAATRTYDLYRNLAEMTPNHPSVAPRLNAVSEALGLGP